MTKSTSRTIRTAFIALVLLWAPSALGQAEPEPEDGSAPAETTADDGAEEGAPASDGSAPDAPAEEDSTETADEGDLEALDDGAPGEASPPAAEGAEGDQPAQGTEAADGSEPAAGGEGTETTLEQADSEELGEMPDEAALPPDAARGLAEPIPRPADADEQLLIDLERFERALRAFEGEVVEYRADISRLVSLEYESRRRDVHDVFDREIDTLRDEERALRIAAIERLEAFVARYPNHPPESPDAMFRLAELYFEKESDDFVAADDAYAQQLDLYDLGRIPDPPDEPEKDYTATIATFQRVIDDFPDYRQVDGARYLMGYALLQMNEEERAVEQFLALVRDFPESDFAQEGWVRIGEYHFEYNEYEDAIAAYTRALDLGEGRLYDEALFKLGWSFYLSNRYQQSLDTFVQLIAFYESSDEVSGALREEALQYMAVTLSEEDWDIDGYRDVNAGLPRVRQQLQTGADWELDVLDRLTEVWFENEQFDLAVEGFRYAIDAWPNDRRNPERHERVVSALSRQRDYENAFTEQMRFAELYGEGTDWYAAQEEAGNIQAMAYADELVRTTVLDSARYFNQQADLLRDQALTNPALEVDAVRAYETAATAYSHFLDQYPNDREAYEVRFLYAQALYYSFNFHQAAGEYAQVRDVEGARQEFAGYQVVKSYEALLTEAIYDGDAEPWALPTFREDNEEPADPERDDVRMDGPYPLHELTELLIVAYDGYVELGLNAEDDPTTQGRFAYLAAKTYFDHYQMDEARARFEAILNNPLYRAQDEGILAASLMIESYRMEEDFTSMEQWANAIAAMDFGGEGMDTSLLETFIEEAETMRVGAAFLNAEALFQAEDYEAAALEYVRLVNQNAESEFAAAALNNAGVAYERIERYESAMQLYQRVVSEYPAAEFVPEALYRVAVNSRRFFDFERATNTYLILASRDDVAEERQRSSLFNAAELQQYSGRYGNAAATFEDFQDTFPDDENSAVALYRAGLMYESDSRYGDMERVWQQMRRDYGSMYVSEEINIDAMVIDTLRRTADYYAEEAGDSRTARGLYSDVLDEFFRRNVTDVDSSFAAGKARFYLAQEEFAVWEAVQITGGVTRQQRIVGEQIAGIPPLVTEFNAVTELGSAEWTMAAYFMLGRIYQAFADKLYTVPIPEEIADDPDLSDVYQMELEDVASQFEDEAVSNWQVAMEVARQTGIVNEWTIRIISELNRYLGSEFPLFKEEIEFMQLDVISPLPLSAPEGVEVESPAPRGRDVDVLDDDEFDDLGGDGGPDSDEFDDSGFDDLDDLEPLQ